MSNSPNNNENKKSQEFLKAYGEVMFNEDKDVSYVEILIDDESILSYYNPATKTMKSIIVSNNEDGFKIQLSIVVNGRPLNGKIFPTLECLKEYLNQHQL